MTPNHMNLVAQQNQQIIGAGRAIGDIAQAKFAAEQQPMAEVPREAERLHLAINVLEDRIAGLDARLSPVTMPRAPQTANAGSQGVEAQAGSHFGQAIQSARSRVDALIQRVDDMAAHLAI